MTTLDNEIFHRKLISKPIIHLNRNQQTRGLAKRTRRQICQEAYKTNNTPRKSQSEEDTDTSPEPPTIKQQGTIGRGRPRLTRDNTTPASNNTPDRQNNTGTGTLTINTDQMSVSDIDQTVKDSIQSGQEIQIKDDSSKVPFDNYKKK